MFTKHYRNPYPVPSVNGIVTAGGAGYNDARSGERFYTPFPRNGISRIQTPIKRMGALVQPHPIAPPQVRAGKKDL